MSCFVFQCIKGNYSNYTKDTVCKASEFLGIAENQPPDIHRINEAMANLHALLDHEGRELPGQEDVVRFIRVIAIIMGNQVDIPYPPEPPTPDEHVQEWFGRDDCEINDENLTLFVGQNGRTVDLKQIHNSLRRTGPRNTAEFFANFMTMLLVQVRPSLVLNFHKHHGFRHLMRNLGKIYRLRKILASSISLTESRFTVRACLVSSMRTPMPITDFIEATLRRNGELPKDFEEDQPKDIKNFM
ncbi:unnamed protein product [Cylicocyclus nassatus]|uniref:Uncharacterized protein n=1 Tax=Cylicocyclus nassatus TaxID=53992 RepID=A0AA36DKF8_CYLNA|nr:unnamed protein product [Cylicocyclus nassatus]